eukprot:TRINITY_DN45261_c0_g1_i1.p1 TRINITY_DN45261_c0_g1~~TRINITY_DN45261_c0_g1_i1.p1  ORF type:complete len:110 (+),score=26.87 TRINITY_DN45261_c0_g1_i1:133-462(+)
MSATCEFKVSVSDKRIAELYGVSGFSAKHTCFCHHFSPEGDHCVLNGIPSKGTRQCKGIMYAKASSSVLSVMGVGSVELQCKSRPGNRTCLETHCPYVAEGGVCPFEAS